MIEKLSNPLLTMGYRGFGLVGIKAIQEQQLLIEDLLKRMEALKKK